MTDATGYCWNCGLPCQGLYCNDKCKRKHEKKTKQDQARHTFNGKKQGYGVVGSTH